jgi:hypothetical protein
MTRQSKFSLIVNDILLLILSYVNFEVKFVMRQTDLVAHILIRAVNICNNFYRFEIIFLCIELLLVNYMKVCLV